MTASLYTHVITVPNDGIRRKGRARIRLRLPRHAVGLDCRCDEKACSSREET